MILHRYLTIPLLACSLGVLALPTTSHAADAAPAPAKARPKIDPEALTQLKRMSDALIWSKSFSYKSTNVHEVPSSTGQFITVVSTADVAIQRPDKLRAKISGETPRFDFYYDGATVTASAPGSKVYSTVKAPATIDAMLAGLTEETGIRFASAPLLFSDPHKVLTRNLKSATVVGQVVVHGVLCEHLAFRSPGVNWEIWIEAAPTALPRRLAVTYTDQANFPRTLVEFTSWNLQPWLNKGSFTFQAPPKAKEIPFNAAMKKAGTH
jgi:hypothetical protein